MRYLKSSFASGEASSAEALRYWFNSVTLENNFVKVLSI